MIPTDRPGTLASSDSPAGTNASTTGPLREGAGGRGAGRPEAEQRYGAERERAATPPGRVGSALGPLGRNAGMG